MNITDKRAYRPLCAFCHDEGCPACESTRAQRFADALRQSGKQAVAEEAVAFMKRNLRPVAPGSSYLMLPRTEDDLLRLLVAAMLYAREPRIAPVVEPETPAQRFDLLEWREP